MARLPFVVPLLLALVAVRAPAAGVADERLAQNYEVVFDTSGSMAERDKIGGARRALKSFLAQVPAEARVGLIVFTTDGRPRRILPLGALDRDRVAALVDPLTAGGNTPIKDSVLLAANSLIGQREKQQGYGSYTVVVVTDGEETVDPNGITGALEQVLARGVSIEVIGFDVPESYSLRNLVTKYRAASDEAELTAALASVLGEAETYDEASRFVTEPGPTGARPPAQGANPPATASTRGSPLLTIMGTLVVLVIVVIAATRSRGARS